MVDLTATESFLRPLNSIMSRYWSNLIHKLTPYTPGEQPKIENLVKLNTNENPYGPSPRVLEAIADVTSDKLRKYPDPEATALKQSIADFYQINCKNVFVGNSSDEVLAHVFRGLLKQDKAILFPDITYSFYPVYCSLFEIEYEQIPLREDFSLQLDDYANDNGGVIFANPNAPTGIGILPEEIERFVQRNTESVVVVDEAYVDFSDISVVHLTEKYPNLLVTQTLSKSRSLAGLRVGLAIAHADLITALERVKSSFHPYALDSLAIAGATASFKDQDYFKSCCQKVVATRRESIDKFQKLGFSVLPSEANFVFVTHPNFNAGKLFEALRAQGVVVRYFDKPRLRDHLRISIGSDQDMQRLFEVLSGLVVS